MSAPVIRDARLPADLPAIESLFADYLAWAHGQAREVLGITEPPGSTATVGADLEVYLASPGAVVIAEAGGHPVGVAVVRTIAPGVAELKRMFVSPAARGTGVGGALLDAAIAAGAATGAKRMRLDTARFMHDAGRLYRTRGFAERDPYPESEIPAELQHHWRFYERPLP